MLFAQAIVAHGAHPYNIRAEKGTGGSICISGLDGFGDSRSDYYLFHVIQQGGSVVC